MQQSCPFGAVVTMPLHSDGSLMTNPPGARSEHPEIGSKPTPVGYVDAATPMTYTVDCAHRQEREAADA